MAQTRKKTTRKKVTTKKDEQTETVESTQQTVEEVVEEPEIEEMTKVIMGDELATVEPSKPKPMVSPGEIISLNAKACPYFGVGQIWLNPDAFWAHIPDDLTEEELQILTAGLLTGKIVKGKVHIPVIDKTNKTPEGYWELVKMSREALDDQVKRMFREALEVDQIDGWTAYEIANYCIAKEEANQNRPRIIRALEEVKKLHTGPTRIPHLEAHDSPEGLKEIKIANRHIAEDPSANTTGPTEGGAAALDQLFE